MYVLLSFYLIKPDAEPTKKSGFGCKIRQFTKTLLAKEEPLIFWERREQNGFVINYIPVPLEIATDEKRMHRFLEEIGREMDAQEGVWAEYLIYVSKELRKYCSYVKTSIWTQTELVNEIRAEWICRAGKGRRVAVYAEEALLTLGIEILSRIAADKDEIMLITDHLTPEFEKRVEDLEEDVVYDYGVPLQCFSTERRFWEREQEGKKNLFVLDLSWKGKFLSEFLSRQKELGTVLYLDACPSAEKENSAEYRILEKNRYISLTENFQKGQGEIIDTGSKSGYNTIVKWANTRKI